MLKLSIFAALTFSTISLNPRHSYSQFQRHLSSSNECCISSGGKLCGRIFSQCCDQQGCLKKWYGVYCKSEKFEPQCKPCSEQCEALGGSVCQVSVSSDAFICCPHHKCKSKETGSIVEKALDRFVDQAVDKTKNKINSKFLRSKKSKQQSSQDEENQEKSQEENSEDDEHLQRNLENERKSELHDTSFVDRLLEKVSGSSSKCTGKPIALPKNCVKDSRMTLMGTLLN